MKKFFWKFNKVTKDKQFKDRDKDKEDQKILK